MNTLFPDRLEKLQKIIKRRRLDALLVTHPDNRRYLSGYTVPDHGLQESAGALLIPARGVPFLFTDSRFQLQAEEEAKGFRIELYPRGLIALLKKVIARIRVERLGFESHSLLHLTAERLKRMTDGLGVTITPCTDLVEQLRVLKSEDEIKAHKASVRLNEQVFKQIRQVVLPGISEKQVASEIERTMELLGADRPCFDTIVAFGANGAKPHAVPTERCLRDGETVLIDMGLSFNGYCSDMTRTFVVGEADKVFLERLHVVRRAQQAGIAAIRAGAFCRDVDRAARLVIEEAGYGPFFGHALGHGVGLNVHEEPRLSPRSRKKLRSGMIVTVEPGIYIPNWGGIRLENMVIVRDDGCEQLNQLPC